MRVGHTQQSDTLVAACSSLNSGKLHQQWWVLGSCRPSARWSPLLLGLAGQDSAPSFRGSNCNTYCHATSCLPDLVTCSCSLVAIPRACLCTAEEGHSWLCPYPINQPYEGCRVLAAPLATSSGLNAENPLPTTIPHSAVEHVCAGANRLEDHLVLAPLPWAVTLSTKPVCPKPHTTRP